MARTSAALKSLVHGITTTASRLANKVFLREQLNLRTITDTGLEKRPPLVLTKLDALTTSNTDTVVVKAFKNGNLDINWLVVIHDQTKALTNVQIIDQLGVSTTPVLDTPDYLLGVLTKEDLEITTQNDTIFVTNKNKLVLVETGNRGQTSPNLVKVSQAPRENSELTITYETIEATLPVTKTVTYTVGVGNLARSTSFVASGIAAAINAEAGDTVAIFGGSIVELLHPTTNTSSKIVVTDDDAGNTLIAISGTVSSIVDLPAYARIDSVITLQEDIQDSKTDIYLVAEEDTTKTALTNTQGVINTAPTFTISPDQVNPASGFEPTDSVGRIFGHYGSAVPMDEGLPTSPVQFLGNNVSFYTVPIALGTGRVQFWTGKKPDANNQGFGGLAPGSVQRLTVTDASGLILLDASILAGTLTEEQVTPTINQGIVWNRYWTNEILQLQPGTTYKVYINEPVNSITTPPLINVLWKETSSPTESFKLAAHTMPHELTAGTLAVIGWDEKGSGNNESNPDPVFIGKTITSLRVFQNRLVALVGNQIQTTETDNNLSWWRNTNTQLLATHPVSMRSTAFNQEDFSSMVNHNRDLLVFSDSAQYKIDGRVALSPQSRSILQTSEYTNFTGIKPVSIGKNVYFMFEYGGTLLGMSKYSASTDENLQDRADSLTEHVRKLIRKETGLHLIGDASKGLVFVVGRKNIWVLDFDPQITNAEFKRLAWSVWKTPESTTIEDTWLDKDKLKIILSRSTPETRPVVTNITETIAGFEVTFDQVIQLSQVPVLLSVTETTAGITTSTGLQPQVTQIDTDKVLVTRVEVALGTDSGTMKYVTGQLTGQILNEYSSLDAEDFDILLQHDSTFAVLRPVSTANTGNNVITLTFNKQLDKTFTSTGIQAISTNATKVVVTAGGAPITIVVGGVDATVAGDTIKIPVLINTNEVPVVKLTLVPPENLPTSAPILEPATRAFLKYQEGVQASNNQLKDTLGNETLGFSLRQDNGQDFGD